jgi:hypothetical protein
MYNNISGISSYVIGIGVECAIIIFDIFHSQFFRVLADPAEAIHGQNDIDANWELMKMRFRSLHQSWRNTNQAAITKL